MKILLTFKILGIENHFNKMSGGLILNTAQNIVLIVRNSVLIKAEQN